ncbi:hypothetical protein T484DRAFT_1783217 [Baffinella frigidus]|nr:hypothetical protein T484DRAFT_1783217 [Cryptophyta sp. CCMP2293]
MWRGQIVLSDRDRRDLVFSSYERTFLDARVASGQGTCTWSDRSRFQGSFRHGVPHGEGRLYHADSDERVPHGEGRLYHADSDERYEGLWGEGQREGFGRWWGAGGEQYVGEWRKGRYHGRGELLTRRGGAYWGGFSEGLFHGIGVLVFQDGQVYIGGFEDGKRHGKP